MADATLTKEFTPVGGSDFQPVGPDVSTITGKPTPTPQEAIQSGKDVAAAAVRYGIPIAAGIANPSLAIPTLIQQALIAGGSEFAARRIERAESDPELDTIWNDLKAGGATGALDLGVNLAFRGMGAAIRKVGQKLLIPSEMPLEVRMAYEVPPKGLAATKAPTEVQIAQEMLGELPNAPVGKPGIVKRFLRFVKGDTGKRPFSLTYGQINAEEQRFIGWLEGISRAGIGSRGVMSGFDLRNEKAVEGLIEKYVEARATEATGPEFARLATRIIGDLKPAREGVGEMFLPVQAYRKFLYTRFETALAESGGLVDGTALRKYIRESGAIQKGLPNDIYAMLRSEGLVPPLETPSSIRKSVTTTRTSKIGEESIDTMQDITRTNLETGKETRKYFSEEGTKAASTKGTTQTIKESETVVGMTEEELAREWANLPASDADKVIKLINAQWKDGNDSVNNILKYMGQKVEDPFQKFLRSDPTLKSLHDAADTFFKKEVNYMRNSAIKAFRKTLAQNPSKVMSLLGGGSTSPNAKVVYDRLISLKQALQFSSETPRVGEALSKAVSAEGLPVGTEAMQKMYDEALLKPLRYRMIANNVDSLGHFNPDGFLQMLNKNADVPEFFEEVFGGATQVDDIKRLMTTLSVLKRGGPEKNIFIQLVQAGQIAGGIGAAGTAIFSDDANIKASSIAGGALVLLGPYAMSRMLTNSTTIRAFTDGLEAGVRSGRFAMGLRKIAEMKVASSFFRDEPSGDAVGYYTSIGEAGK